MKWQWTQKNLIIIAASVAVVGGGVCVWAVWFHTPVAPDPAAQTPEQIAHYLASDEFGKLPEDRQQEYFIAARQQSGGRRLGRRENLSDQERENLRRNIGPLFQREMEQRMEKYFQLPPEQRTAYLDAMIDRMQRGRRNRPPRTQPAGQESPRPGASGQQGRRERRGFNPSRMRDHIENSDPKTRAQRTEFRKAMRERMKQRGIEPRGGRR